MRTVRDKSIVLDVGEGDFDRGFPIVLRISRTGTHTLEFRGQFPPAPEIPRLYAHWQTAYYRCGANHRWWRMLRIDFPPQITNVSYWDECNDAARLLQEQLKQWFDLPEMRDLREEIRVEVHRKDRARLIVRTQDRWLRRLPWHLWSLLEHLPQLEIGISAHYAETSRQLSSPVKILAVLGNSEGIDTRVDPTLLEALPNAAVERLVEPTRQEFSDRLFERHWDILFFAGHSSSEVNGETGYIWLNDTDRLTPSEIKFALSRAVEKGLQLAIFNSCDGLGLARELADLQIPYMIVMREPVPDRIAQAFLQYFLRAFAGGDPFYLAVRKAREQLQSLEMEYPCASWLPVICQSPAAPVLKYPRHSPRRVALVAVAGAIALTGISLLAQQWWQDFQIQARMSSGENLLVKSVTNADKIAGVTALREGNFRVAVNRFERSRQQDRSDPEILIYLNNARIGDREALKLAVSVPIDSNSNVSQEILRGVAQAQNEIDYQGGINGYPLKVEIANDANDPDIAKAIATRLVKDPQVLAVVGHNASDASVAAAPVYDKGGLIMITPTSYSDKLSSISPYVLRMVPSIHFLADKLATYYIKTHSDAKIAICSDASSVDNETYRNQFTNGILGVLLQAPTQAKAKLVPFSCDLSSKDFDPNAVIADLKSRGVNTLLLAPHIDRLRKAIDLAKANRGQLQLLGTPPLYTATTLEQGQSAVNNLLLPTPWYPTTLPNSSFPREVVKLWGGPVSWRTAMAYDATRAIAAGLQSMAVGKPYFNREGLKNALRSSDFSINGASGSVRFTQSGEREIVPGFGVLVRVRAIPGSKFGYDFVPIPSEASTR